MTKVIELENGSTLNITPTDEGVVFDHYDKKGELIESGWMNINDIKLILH